MLGKRRTTSFIVCLFAFFTNYLAVDAKQPAPPSPHSSGPPQLQFEHKSPVLHVAWSPDGRFIATCSGGGLIRIFDAATGKENQSFSAGDGAGALAFAPDGKSLAVVDSGKIVGIWDLATCKVDRKTDTPIRGSLDRLSFTPNGKVIMAVGPNALVMWSAPNCGLRVYHEFQGLRSAALSPDGTICFFNGSDGMWFHFEYDRAKNSLEPSDAMFIAKCVAYGPTGKPLAICSDDKGFRLSNFSGGEPSVFVSTAQPVSHLVFSIDGGTLATLANDEKSILIYNVPRIGARSQIQHFHDAIGTLSLSPDGKLLATTAKDGHFLNVWSTAGRVLTPEGPLIVLSATEMAVLWSELANTDASTAYKAWQKLGGAGDNAVPWLREQIRPLAVPAFDIKHLGKLVADLDSDKYATRDLAIKELVAVGELAIVPLQHLLEKPPSAEARERAKLVLKKIAEPPLTPDRQRVLQAIELLEQLNTAKATSLLEEIERDALIPQIHLQAKRALQRIGR